MTHFTVYQSRIKDNGAEEVTNLYEYEDEDQAQDEVTRINRNLQLAGVPSTVSYAYYEDIWRKRGRKISRKREF
jgi:hypothetical protein